MLLNAKSLNETDYLRYYLTGTFLYGTAALILGIIYYYLSLYVGLPLPLLATFIVNCDVTDMNNIYYIILNIFVDNTFSFLTILTLGYSSFLGLVSDSRSSQGAWYKNQQVTLIEGFYILLLFLMFASIPLLFGFTAGFSYATTNIKLFLLY